MVASGKIFGVWDMWEHGREFAGMDWNRFVPGGFFPVNTIWFSGDERISACKKLQTIISYGFGRLSNRSRSLSKVSLFFLRIFPLFPPAPEHHIYYRENYKNTYKYKYWENLFKISPKQKQACHGRMNPYIHISHPYPGILNERCSCRR